jgi:hypothetical protein
MTGSGCFGSAGVPVHTVTGTPDIGGQLQFNAGTLPNPSVAALLLGFQNQTYNGLPLPMDLTALGAPTCFLRTDIAVTQAALANGSASWTLTLPNDPTIIGASLYSQTAVVDPPANALGITLSSARRVTVGGWN